MSEAPLPPRKKMSGCMLAVVIVGALGLLAVIGITATVVFALRTPEGSALLDMVKTASEAQTGPGAVALRAQGCANVGVLPVAALNEIAKSADAGPVISEFATLLVSCFDPPADRTCDALAAVYVTQAKTTGPIRFAIVQGADEQDRCAGYYDTAGRAMSPPAEAAQP
jgi:hypothetical protein